MKKIVMLSYSVDDVDYGTGYYDEYCIIENQSDIDNLKTITKNLDLYKKKLT